MKHAFAALLMALLASLSPAAAATNNGLVTIESASGVQATADKLENILKSKGVTVFARIDHAAGAKKAGQTLRPTLLLIFGNPKLGTPLMTNNQTIGIDLPLKALIFQASNGRTYITYNNPAYLAERHAIRDRSKVFDKMAGALKNFTAGAAKK